MLFAALISCGEAFFFVFEDEEDEEDAEDEDFVPLLDDGSFFNVPVENEDLGCSFSFFSLTFLTL